MTTLVADFRRKIMVSDNQCTTNSGGYKIPCTKVYRIATGPNKGHIVGHTGHEATCSIIMDMYEAGALNEVEFWQERPEHRLSIDPELQDEPEVVILRPDGIWVVDHWLRPYPIETEYYAAGSGCQFALGAMDAGVPAEKAVEIAAQRDPWSNCFGKPVQTMTLDM